MDINDERLLLLVRSGLFHQAVDPDLFADADDSDWNCIYRQAHHQGVTAIACDGIKMLPAENRPYEDLYLKWIVVVDALEKRYAKQCEVAASLDKLFREHGLRMLVVKGIGVSHYYPCPAHRECGDIDIYLFGKQVKGDKIIKSQGIKIYQEKDYRSKHSCFDHQGVCVENHRYFLEKRSLFKNNALYEQEMMSSLDKNTPKEGELLFPSILFDSLYLPAHISTHIVGRRGIALRYVCDWAMFLYHNHANIDFEKVVDLFEKTDRLTLAEILTVISVNELGLPRECAGRLYSDRNDDALAGFILQNKIMCPRFRSISATNAVGIVAQKIHRVRINQKIYKCLFGKSFAKRYAFYSYWDRLFHLNKLLSTPRH